MLCSAMPGKSGSNWLDRLRSTKGIPTGDDLDLDSFLSTHHSSDDPPNRLRNRTRVPALSIPDTPDPTPIASLLADLFNMGGSLSQSSKLSHKKCPRKQTNPKSFLPSSSSSLSSNSRIQCAPKDDNTVPCTNSSSNNRVLEMGVKEENTVPWDEDVEDEAEKEKESGGNELKGFSKSEVTVIDTSCSEWKVDKFVFRKNSVWKVREKKGKSKFLGKKKRKGSFGFDKELKLLESQIGSSVETDMQELMTRSTQELNTEQEMKDVNEETPEYVPKPPPKKRFQFSRAPPKSTKENKSVIIIKTIPT